MANQRQFRAFIPPVDHVEYGRRATIRIIDAVTMVSNRLRMSKSYHAANSVGRDDRRSDIEALSAKN